MTTGATHREAHDGLQGRLLVLIMSMMVLLANEVGKTRTIAKAMDVTTSKVPEFPALFVFGDSLLDPGNGVQQEASTSSRLPFHFSPNHLPYGRDLPSHLPSGRFSNGLVLSDILAKLIGLPYPPAYLLERDNIMKGTSFATEGAMILNYTSKVLIPRLNFHDQVGLFEKVRQKLVSSLGESNSDSLISKSLLLIWMGSNDYYINYNANPFGQTSSQRKYNPNEFRQILISAYRDYIVVS
eukprot:c22278_g1_i1 orf=306-1025(-)